MRARDSIGLPLLRALAHARLAILSVFLTYLVAVAAGMLMVHLGNPFALDYRDRLVGDAQGSSITVAYRQGDGLRAAVLDFEGNLVGAVSNTLGGLGVIFPYPLIVYRGWVGGIVSVDGAHASRLANPSQAAYYLSVLLLQLIPYSLATGAGVNVGLSLWRLPVYYAGKKWLGVPREAVRDALRIYALVVPLFLLASLWEFLSPWN